ncbi:MAG: GNAT family N-acetyltransferase [Anaerolineae bacterium]|nr:GNAT family N-acetyltransferase [Anaerolineae bacterium]
MIVIKPIEQHQITDAKRVILSIGRNLYQWEASLDEIIQQFAERGELADIDDYEKDYIEQCGMFLVVMDQDQVIGTGAIQRIDDCVCELKRLWLLEKYQGNGIGYRLLKELIEFARKHDYKILRLETDKEKARAKLFYQQVGFHSIPKYNNRNSDICMAMEI